MNRIIVILLFISAAGISCAKHASPEVDSASYEITGSSLEKMAGGAYEYTIEAESRFSRISMKGLKDKDGYIEASGYIRTAGDEPYEFDALYDMNEWYERKGKTALSGDDPPDPSFIITNCITESEPEFISVTGRLAKYSIKVNVAFIDPINYECPGYVYVRDGSFLERITAEREGLSLDIRMKRTNRDIKEVKNVNFVYSASGSGGIISIIAKRLEANGSGYRNGGKLFLYDEEKRFFEESVKTDSLRFSDFIYTDPGIESENVRFLKGDVRNTLSVLDGRVFPEMPENMRIEGEGPLYSLSFISNAESEAEICCYTKNWAFKCEKTPSHISVQGLTLQEAEMLAAIMRFPYGKGKFEIKEER